jgi:hypothetical protein
MMPASTFRNVRAEGFVVLLVVRVFRLTLFRRSRLLGRNLNTVFSSVNTLRQLFSMSPERVVVSGNAAGGAAPMPWTSLAGDASYLRFMKVLFFSAFFSALRPTGKAKRRMRSSAKLAHEASMAGQAT